jgi:hypothetical protein
MPYINVQKRNNIRHLIYIITKDFSSVISTDVHVSHLDSKYSRPSSFYKSSISEKSISECGIPSTCTIFTYTHKQFLRK